MAPADVEDEDDEDGVDEAGDVIDEVVDAAPVSDGYKLA